MIRGRSALPRPGPGWRLSPVHEPRSGQAAGPGLLARARARSELYLEPEPRRPVLLLPLEAEGALRGSSGFPFAAVFSGVAMKLSRQFTVFGSAIFCVVIFSLYLMLDRGHLEHPKNHRREGSFPQVSGTQGGQGEGGEEIVTFVWQVRTNRGAKTRGTRLGNCNSSLVERSQITCLLDQSRTAPISESKGGGGAREFALTVLAVSPTPGTSA